MTQLSFFWGGTSTGDASEAPYDDNEFSDLWVLLHQYDRVTQGVVPVVYDGDIGNTLASSDLSGMLEVTNPAGTTIRIAPGVAIVDGKVFVNDANVDDPDGGITAPGAGTNYYRVVLCKDFVAQTVRIALLGPDAAAAPAVTQTDGTTWEISLATVSITDASVVTVTDDRTTVDRGSTNSAVGTSTTFGGRTYGTGLVTVGGGHGNAITGCVLATIGGGYNNAISASYATVGGGSANDVSGNSGVIAGGKDNTISSTVKVLP